MLAEIHNGIGYSQAGGDIDHLPRKLMCRPIIRYHYACGQQDAGKQREEAQNP
jgi:hypothetical protein